MGWKAVYQGLNKIPLCQKREMFCEIEVLFRSCVRKLFTGLIIYLPSQNKEHCIVLYCIDHSDCGLDGLCEP